MPRQFYVSNFKKKIFYKCLLCIEACFTLFVNKEPWIDLASIQNASVNAPLNRFHIRFKEMCQETPQKGKIISMNHAVYRFPSLFAVNRFKTKVNVKNH